MLAITPAPFLSPSLVSAAEAEAFLAQTVDADAPRLLELATHAVVRLLGERGSCILFDGTPRVAVATDAPSFAGHVVDLKKYPEIEAAIAGRVVVAIEDAQTDVRLRPVQAQLPPGVRAVAVVPLLVRERCVGVLVARSSHVRPMSEDALATASLVGRITARLLPSDSAAREREVFAVPLPVPVPDDAKRRVLVIDDDDDAAFLVGEVLRREGFETQRAADGETGIRLAREKRPDLIILDVNMPKLDGYGTARILDADPLTHDVPIVFLSGSTELLTRIRELRIEHVDFLAKPFKRQELLTRIDRAFALADSHRQAQVIANTDELTGLANLRLLRQRLAVEQARWQRYGTPVTVVTIDVDKLKRINDTLGHDAGSRALAKIAEVVRNDIRETDLAVRYGGDEFVVLLSHASEIEGARFADRLLEHVRQIEDSTAKPSVSIGIATLTGASAVDLETVLRRSDAAAYRAKRAGGDRVCVYEPSSDVMVGAPTQTAV